MPGNQSGNRTYTAREVGGAFVIVIGIAMIASALVINPIVARAWQGVYAVDKALVMRSYCLWALGLGGLVIWLGNRFSQTAKAGGIDRALLIVLPLSLLMLGDRFLLVEFGLPLWQHDPQLHYRHRPNAIRTLARAGYPNDVISINRHGHHDTDYPIEKPPGEFRGLMIGDSVTMGDRVPYRDTYSAQLEALLARHDPSHPGFEIINAGVHGYSTYQERFVLEDSLRFEHDFIAIGFCMNDLLDPSVVKRSFEGATIDYHRVAPTSNSVLGYLMNETGAGRLAQRVFARGRSRAVERQHQLSSVRQIASATNDPESEKAFTFTLQDLGQMYELAQTREIPIVLLIFPFAFQLLDEEARVPQQRLTQHADAKGVPAIDFTQNFAERVYADRELLALLRAKGYTTEEIEQTFAWRMREYFLDEDHFTTLGHSVVAEELFHHLVSTGIVR